jgi:hypothetical protein
MKPLGSVTALYGDGGRSEALIHTVSTKPDAQGITVHLKASKQQLDAIKILNVDIPHVRVGTEFIVEQYRFGDYYQLCITHVADAFAHWITRRSKNPLDLGSGKTYIISHLPQKRGDEIQKIENHMYAFIEEEALANGFETSLTELEYRDHNAWHSIDEEIPFYVFQRMVLGGLNVPKT